MKDAFHLALICTAMLITAQGCTSSPDLLSDKEQAAMLKIRSGQYSIISNAALTTLKRDAEIGKAVGRYQIHREGFRTWRLDTATGHLCLLLTAEFDWKKPETSGQACLD